MFTLYSPVTGVVSDQSEADGLTVIACPGSQNVATPTRGTVTRSDGLAVTITDLRDRVVELRLDAEDGSVQPLVAQGDTVGFDQAIFSWTGAGELRVLVTSPGAADLLAHATAGEDIAAGADLFSVGPFACGA